MSTYVKSAKASATEAAAPLTITVAQQTKKPPAIRNEAATAVAVDRIVDEALIESFPASDPPSWWAGAR